MESIPQPAHLAPTYEGKMCSHCRECKPLAQFSRNKARKDGLHTECKSCNKAQDARYKATYPERVRATKRRLYWKNPKHSSEVAARWRANHPERARARDARYRKTYAASIPKLFARWYALNKEERIKRIRQWRQANPDRVRTNKNNRRARQITAEGSYTLQEWVQLKARFDNRCLRCFRQEPDVVITVDHIVPLSKGGTNYIHNLQPICWSCNSSKRDRHICYRPDKLLSAPTA